MRAKRLGLFGGSFNPVHTGHVLLARYALEQLGLDGVLFMPCARSADGKKLAPGALRLAWLKKALRGEAGMRASGLELERGGVSRTVDTLRQLHELQPQTEWTLLMGADQAARLKTWKESGALPKLARLAAFARPGQKVPAKMFRITAPSLEISSSEIRLRIKQKQSVRLLLPPALANEKSLLHNFR